MNRPSAVVDTNVLISAAIKFHGLEAAVLDLVAHHQLSVAVSAPIVAEYDLVTRNKRHFPARSKRTEVVNARELNARLDS